MAHIVHLRSQGGVSRRGEAERRRVRTDEERLGTASAAPRPTQQPTPALLPAVFFGRLGHYDGGAGRFFLVKTKPFSRRQHVVPWQKKVPRKVAVVFGFCSAPRSGGGTAVAELPSLRGAWPPQAVAGPRLLHPERNGEIAGADSDSEKGPGHLFCSAAQSVAKRIASSPGGATTRCPLFGTYLSNRKSPMYIVLSPVTAKPLT